MKDTGVNQVGNHGNGVPMQDEGDVAHATEQFRDALLLSNSTRTGVGGVETAAARFCEVMRDEGHSPERALIKAKEVIEEAIDGHNRALAEAAVLSCIRHYYGE